MIERRLVGRQVTTLGTMPAPFRTATVGPPIVTAGLLGYWDAADPRSYPGSGTTWTDLSGNSNTGTLTNGPTYDADRGGKIVFDGSDDNVLCSGSNTVTAATFVAVVRRNGTQTQYAGIMASRPSDFSGSAGSDVNGVLMYDTTTNLTYIWEAQVATYTWNSGISVPDGAWCMIALTITSTTATMYRCSNVGITSATNSTTHGSTTIGRLLLGCDQVAATTYRTWKGDGAVYMLYDRALSATEVEQNFSALRGRFNI